MVASWNDGCIGKLSIKKAVIPAFITQYSRWETTPKYLLFEIISKLYKNTEAF
jgi:hypothetical protein